MKTKVYENKEQILILFDDKDNPLERYGATEISKTCLGASCGMGFDTLKEVRTYIKKHRMKFVKKLNLKKFTWKNKNEVKNK